MKFLGDRGAPDRDDPLTLAAIGAIAACISTVAHEVIGHGSACLAGGSRIRLVTSVYFRCVDGNPLIDIAGPATNLAAGLIAAILLFTLRRTAPRIRLLLLFVMAFSLFWEAGYLLYGAVFDEGDWALALRAWLSPDPAVSRAAALILGFLLYVAADPMVTRGVRSIAGPTASLHRIQVILRWGWLGGAGGAVLAASLFAGAQWEAIRQAALGIGVASFPLLVLPLKPPPVVEGPPRVVAPGSFAWVMAGIVVFIAFAATLGRGMSFG